MREVYSTHKGWETVVKNKQSITSPPPHHEIFKIQLMCRYVAAALDIALNCMHLYDMTWSKCCQNSIKKLSIENMKEERDNLVQEIKMNDHKLQLIAKPFGAYRNVVQVDDVHFEDAFLSGQVK